MAAYPAHWAIGLDRVHRASAQVQTTSAAAAKQRMRQMIDFTKLVKRGQHQLAQKLVDSPPAREYAACAEAVSELEVAIGDFLGERRGHGEEFDAFAARVMPLFESVEAIRAARCRNGLGT